VPKAPFKITYISSIGYFWTAYTTIPRATPVDSVPFRDATCWQWG